MFLCAFAPIIITICPYVPIKHLNVREQDAATFAEWGVDYVKNDACYPQTPNIKGGGINQNHEGVGFLLYEPVNHKLT